MLGSYSGRTNRKRRGQLAGRRLQVVDSNLRARRSVAHGHRFGERVCESLAKDQQPVTASGVSVFPGRVDSEACLVLLSLVFLVCAQAFTD